MSKEAMKLALEALEQIARITGARWALENSYAGHLEAITALREALTSVPDWASEAIEQPAPAQQGWETVPVEPTVAMIDATGAVEADMREMVVANWKEMLAAAPQPTQRQSRSDVKPPTDEEIEIRIGYRLPPHGFDAIRQLIKENT